MCAQHVRLVYFNTGYAREFSAVNERTSVGPTHMNMLCVLRLKRNGERRRRRRCLDVRARARAFRSAVRLGSTLWQYSRRGDLRPPIPIQCMYTRGLYLGGGGCIYAAVLPRLGNN